MECTALSRVVGIACAASAWMAAQAVDAATPRPDADAPFAIDLPQGCQIDKRPGPDFFVYYVACHGTTYAGVYVGNFADRSVPRSRLIKTGRQFPAEIQVWSVAVPNDQARADAIAASVKLRPNR